MLPPWPAFPASSRKPRAGDQIAELARYAKGLLRDGVEDRQKPGRAEAQRDA